MFVSACCTVVLVIRFNPCAELLTLCLLAVFLLGTNAIQRGERNSSSHRNALPGCTIFSFVQAQSEFSTIADFVDGEAFCDPAIKR